MDYRLSGLSAAALAAGNPRRARTEMDALTKVEQMPRMVDTLAACKPKPTGGGEKRVETAASLQASSRYRDVCS